MGFILGLITGVFVEKKIEQYRYINNMSYEEFCEYCDFLDLVEKV